VTTEKNLMPKNFMFRCMSIVYNRQIQAKSATSAEKGEGRSSRL